MWEKRQALRAAVLRSGPPHPVPADIPLSMSMAKAEEWSRVGWCSALEFRALSARRQRSRMRRLFAMPTC